MKLNTISSEPGSRPSPKRVGRGIGSGLGKTSGRGHKGQKARSGGSVKVGFEGGQMPLQRRLPKRGFTSRVSFASEQIRTSELNKVSDQEITIDTLKKYGLIKKATKFVKVFKSGDITNAVKLIGIAVSAGAKDAIEKAGGSVEE